MPGATDNQKDPDPFEGLDPGDGYRVVRVEVGDSLSLACEVYSGGEQINLWGTAPEDATVEIKEWPLPDAADKGACTRLRLVLDAVARYLTTGGQWDELDPALQRLRRVAAGGLLYPGYYYAEGYSTTEGTYQHIFVRDDGGGDAVLWEEPAEDHHGFVDLTTVDQINEQRHEDGWRPIRQAEQEDEAGEPEPDFRPALPPPARPGPEDQAGLD